MRKHRVLSAVLALVAGLLGIVIGGSGASAAAPPSGADCHDSYEGFCVRIDLGDLDCEDIGHAVIVIGDDEFRLDDEDADNIGCEEFGGLDGGGAGVDDGRDGEELADTGSTSAPLIATASMAVVLGGVALLISRRRTA